MGSLLPEPGELKAKLNSLSRQQRRALLRKGYQFHLREMKAPLTRKETRLIASEAASELIEMLKGDS